MLREPRNDTEFEKYLYDVDGDFKITAADYVLIKNYLEGGASVTTKQIKSRIELGTNAGTIKTTVVSPDGLEGNSSVIIAEKIVSDLIETKGFSTKRMFLNEKEVIVDSNGFLKITP